MDAKSRAQRADKNPVTPENLDNFTNSKVSEAAVDLSKKYVEYLDNSNEATETYSERRQPKLSQSSPKQSVVTEGVDRKS